MKKYLLIFVLLFIPFLVKAESCNIDSITIDNMEIEELYGETLEKSEPVIDGLNIKLDLKLTEVGDYVKYKITVTNNSEDSFEFNKNKLVTNSDFINYTFDNNENETIEAHETKDIYLTIKYNKKVSNTSFENGVFNENKKVQNILSEGIVNPQTGDFNIELVILVALVLSIVMFFYFRKKEKSVYYFGILLMISLIIPLKIYAICKVEINVDSSIEIEEYSNRDIYNISSDDSMLDSIKSKYVEKVSGVDFTKPSSDTNGKGLYIFDSSKNDKYPIYYFRGNVDNNNVLFGGFCWKILRTTSTGGTKLVYNGKVNSEGTCNNSEEDTLVALKVKYSASGNLSYFGYAYEVGHAFKTIKISSVANDSVFAEDVSYEDGKYILSDNRYIKDSNLSSNIDLLKDHHYSCFKKENEDCTSVNYVYMTRGGYLYYIILNNGENIDDALNKDLKESPNSTNSNIKTYIENWYRDNLNSYTSYLEDEVWCNDRSIYSYGGWNKNSSIADDNKIILGSLGRALDGKPSLKCINKNDSFTTSTDNGNGKNTYPVGLITLDEALLAGFSWNTDDNTNYLYNGKVWWTMSPTLNSVQLGYIGVLHSMADNVNTVYVSANAGGVRPSIVIKNGIKIKDGNGSSSNPFTLMINENPL